MLYPNQVLSNVKLTDRFTLIWTTNADTGHYMAIAKNGYVGESAAFFPLWPLIIRILGSTPIMAKVLACFFSFLFIVFFVRLISLLGYSKIKEEIVLLFLAFPSSFLLTAPFSEPLFLSLSALTFVLVEQKRYAAAALIAALASAARPVGIVLTLYLALRLYGDGVKTLKKYWWTLLISPAGLLLYSAYLFITFGKFTLFWSAQTSGWGRQLGVASFIKLFRESMEVIGQVFGSYKPVPINLLQVAVIPFSIFLSIIAFKKINKALWFFSMLMIIIPLSSGTYVASLREILAAFPLFIPFGVFLTRRKTLFYLYLFSAILFQSLFLIRFLNYEWVF